MDIFCLKGDNYLVIRGDKYEILSLDEVMSILTKPQETWTPTGYDEHEEFWRESYD